MGFIVFAQSDRGMKKSVPRLALCQLRCINAFFSLIHFQWICFALSAVFLNKSIITISHKSFWIQLFLLLPFSCGSAHSYHNLFRLFSGAPCCILRFILCMLHYFCIVWRISLLHTSKATDVSHHEVSLLRREIGDDASRNARICYRLRWGFEFYVPKALDTIECCVTWKIFENISFCFNNVHNRPTKIMILIENYQKLLKVSSQKSCDVSLKSSPVNFTSFSIINNFHRCSLIDK